MTGKWSSEAVLRGVIPKIEGLGLKVLGFLPEMALEELFRGHMVTLDGVFIIKPACGYPLRGGRTLKSQF